MSHLSAAAVGEVGQGGRRHGSIVAFVSGGGRPSCPFAHRVAPLQPTSRPSGLVLRGWPALLPVAWGGKTMSAPKRVLNKKGAKATYQPHCFPSAHPASVTAHLASASRPAPVGWERETTYGGGRSEVAREGRTADSPFVLVPASAARACARAAVSVSTNGALACDAARLPTRKAQSRPRRRRALRKRIERRMEGSAGAGRLCLAGGSGRRQPPRRGGAMR